MASQVNGGITVPGNIRVFGDGTINGDVSIAGTITVASVVATTSAVTSLTASSFVKLTPLASAPATPAEGALYAGTDHKLYFYNGTAWKEVAFV